MTANAKTELLLNYTKAIAVVNLQMVKVGQAFVYRRYLSGYASTKSQYLQTEAQVIAQTIGLLEATITRHGLEFLPSFMWWLAQAYHQQYALL